MKVLKPTIFAGAPRIFLKIQKGYKEGIAKKEPFVQVFANLIIDTIQTMQSHESQEKFFFNKSFLDALGGNIRLLICGMETLDIDLQKFLKGCLNTPFIQGYGLTETAAGALVQCDSDNLEGSVGVPIACCQVKLRDVPEKNLFAKNNQGELLIKGPMVFKKYFNNDDLAKEQFEDGWFATGDYFQINSTGQFQLIDLESNENE